jgi:hypothetical protein
LSGVIIAAGIGVLYPSGISPAVAMPDMEKAASEAITMLLLILLKSFIMYITNIFLGQLRKIQSKVIISHNSTANRLQYSL